MAVQPVLPSTVLNGSASAMTSLSGLNTYPIKITVYASRAPSLTPPQHSLSGGLLRPYPSRTSTGRTAPACLAHQHSLPSARYGLLGPVSHRLENASFLAHMQNIRRKGKDAGG